MRLLIIDDEVIQQYKTLIDRVQFRQNNRWEVEYASKAVKGLELLKGDWSAVILDLHFPGEYDSYEKGLHGLLDIALRKANQRYPIIVATSDQRDDTEGIALRKGAIGLLRKDDYDPQQWEFKIQDFIHAFARRGKFNISDAFFKKVDEQFIAISDRATEVKARLRTAVNYPKSAVLITGEPGTGKEVAAKYLHAAKRNPDLPFYPVNLSSFNSELINSELFGHVKGAFTSATNEKAGFFEMAKNGTLFIDEIGEVSLDIQVKLLRVLQERVFQRVGSTQDQSLNAQLIFSTNRDLKVAVSEGKFRPDFYERIKAITIHIPPLRERKADIPHLAERFLNDFCHELNPLWKKDLQTAFSPDALSFIQSYHWPGNIRQLSNTIQNVLFEIDISGKKVIDQNILKNVLREVVYEEESPTTINSQNTNYTEPLFDNEHYNWPLDKQGAFIELKKIEKALIQSGNKYEVALSLGMKNEQNLRYRVIRHYKNYPELFEEFSLLKKSYKL